MRKRQSGFSLLEVGLALSLGALLMGAAVLGYRAVRERSGDAAMRQKVQDLRVLVEELYAPAQALPSDLALRDAWQQRRPADFNKSPWGGPVIDTMNPDRRGISSATLANGSVLFQTANGPGPLVDGGFENGLYYYPILPAANGEPGTVEAYDISRNATTSVSLYMVAGNKYGNVGGQWGGWRHYYVQSGR